MTEHWEINLPFDGDVADKKIVCHNCHWSWNLKDGGNDPYVCHICNTDNSKYYLSENYSNADYSQAITQGIGAVSSIGSSIAQSKAQKEAGKTDIQREIDTKCGKDKSKSWSKKKKTAYYQCKQNVLNSIDSEKRLSKEEKQKAQELLQKQSAEREKSQRTQTYVVIGLVAVIIGFVIYKKMN